ncbi:unnamed protein product, partial [Ectocarpus sp. 12 AP-2014]
GERRGEVNSGGGEGRGLVVGDFSDGSGRSGVGRRQVLGSSGGGVAFPVALSVQFQDSTGHRYRQLVEGADDIRQDAVMEQGISNLEISISSLGSCGTTARPSRPAPGTPSGEWCSRCYRRSSTTRRTMQWTRR